MTPERWQQVRELLDLALALDPARVDSFLVAACSGDEDLATEIKSLIAAARRQGTALDKAALAPHAVAIGPESIVAGYRIVSKLGEGGVAQVFDALSPVDGSRVALKLIRQSNPAGGGLELDLRRRFLRETRFAKQLRHPNIVQVIEVIDESEVSAIVMELVEGSPLSSHIVQGGMPVAAALRAGTEVCAGLAAAHAVGIIHRDLKPANVMMDGDGTAKVLDFGAAKQLFRDTVGASENTSTARGMVIGTPTYMSPEQVRGERVDHRSDIFPSGACCTRCSRARHRSNAGRHLRPCQRLSARTRGRWGTSGRRSPPDWRLLSTVAWPKIRRNGSNGFPRPVLRSPGCASGLS